MFLLIYDKWAWIFSCVSLGSSINFLVFSLIFLLYQNEGLATSIKFCLNHPMRNDKVNYSNEHNIYVISIF